MDLVTLPDHINCTHVGTYSPVLFRLEGGNISGGFCVEEYMTTPPHINLYGSLGDSKAVFCSAVKSLPRFLELVYSTSTDIVESKNFETSIWFRFELRPSDYCLSIYCGAHGISINGVTPRSRLMRADLHATQQRLETIFERFYDANV